MSLSSYKLEFGPYNRTTKLNKKTLLPKKETFSHIQAELLVNSEVRVFQPNFNPDDRHMFVVFENDEIVMPQGAAEYRAAFSSGISDTMSCRADSVAFTEYQTDGMHVNVNALCLKGPL